jgi:hypothetical protein
MLEPNDRVVVRARRYNGCIHALEGCFGTVVAVSGETAMATIVLDGIEGTVVVALCDLDMLPQVRDRREAGLLSRLLAKLKI